MNTYTKLRDGWGVRATQPVKAGDQIQVQTKAGAIKFETVSRVLWEGPNKRTGQKVYLLAIRGGGGRRLLPSGEEDTGCWECRELGHLCDRCAFDEYDN